MTVFFDIAIAVVMRFDRSVIVIVSIMVIVIVVGVWDAMIMMLSGAGSGRGSKERCESELHLVFEFVFLFGLMRHNFRLLLYGWVSVNRLGQIWSSEKFKASSQRIC